MVQALYLPLLLFTFLTDPDQFIEQNRAFLFRLDLVGVVLAQLRLQEVSHLGQLRFAL